MLLDLATSLLLFPVVTLGLAWPLASRLALDPAERLVASTVLSLLAAYLVSFAIYLLALPSAAFWLLPVLAAAGLITGRQALIATVRDADARALLAGQLLVTGWCTGWLCFIVNYSGGGWAGDWFEHWERTRFFLEHWARDAKFLTLYDLPARPPLANLVTGAFLAVTSRNFAHYQLFTTLLSSLAFLPAALLVRRFSSRRPGAAPAGAGAAVAVFTVLVMLNPSFVQNATFAWTKLITVCFILSGLYFFLRTLDAAPPRAAGPLCAGALAAALLAHYSAGPYVLLLALAWPVVHRSRWREAAFWRETAWLGLLGGLLLATWFGWSLAVYGPQTTLLSNSSVTVKDAQSGSQLLKIALNLRDTFVPHFLRPLDGSLIAQRSPWGYWHDWFFQVYQLNLFFVFGSVGWLVLIRELSRGWSAAPRRRWYWAWLIAGAIVLGVAVHGARDVWGLAHICLQSLVVLGLGCLAAGWTALGRGWRRLVVAGATVDFCLGIALHFAVQSYALDHWLTPGRPFGETLRSYGAVDLMNAVAKASMHLEFFSAAFAVPAALGLGLLAALLTLAVGRAARRSA